MKGEGDQKPPALSLRAKVNLGLALALGLLCVVGGMAFWSTEQFAQAARERRRSYDTQIRLARLVADLHDAETGQRRYLLTNRMEYLAPFVSGSTSVARNLRELQEGITDSLEQRHLRTLEPLIQARLADLSRKVTLQREGRRQDVMALVMGGEGKQLMDGIRQVAGLMDSVAVARTNLWNARVEAATRVTLITIGTVGVLALLLVTFAGLVTNRGVVRRAQAEAALRESEARLFQVLEALPVAVFVADASGKPYYANRASHEILGQGIVNAAPDQIAQVYQAYVAGTDQLYPTDRLPIIRAVAGHRAHVTDLEIHTPERTIPVEVWAAPVLDAEGRVTWGIAAFSDTTEQRRAEADLRQAKEAAEAANYAKSDFLAKMSHELRTPLNSIIGFSEMLQDESFGTLNEKQRRYVGNVLTSGRNLLQLINDILDLSKVEAGHMELMLAEFDIEAALAEVQVIVGTLVNKKQVTLEVEVEDHLPTLRADQGKVKQVLYNLLSNAIKFTPPGGRIRLTARRALEIEARERGEWIEIAVADTGIGIRPEDQERVFGEFEQVNSGYTRSQEGTGLGLALSRRLVELHGGWIWVESEIGAGSTFRFVLPSARQPGPQYAAPPDGGAEPADGRPLILIVEDDGPARELIAQQLVEAGYRVAQAATGGQAVALAKELQPAGITLDILLPDGDGLDVLAQLKSLTETRDIPVLVVSITENQELGLSLGAVDWVMKPLNRAQFLAAVHRAFAGRPADGPATVLVIDDELPTIELLTDLLGSQGYRVLSAVDGRNGIEVARAERPDLIVLDILMPETTGFEVVRELRAHLESRDTPILIFTVKDLTPEERERLRGSVHAIVTKGATGDLLRELARIRPARSTDDRGA